MKFIKDFIFRRKIEKGLGIKLYKWQRDYIFRNKIMTWETAKLRQNGKTLACVIDQVYRYTGFSPMYLVFFSTDPDYEKIPRGSRLNFYQKELNRCTDAMGLQRIEIIDKNPVPMIMGLKREKF